VIKRALGPYTTNEITSSFLVLMLQQRNNKMTLLEEERLCYHITTKHVGHNTKNEVAVILMLRMRRFYPS